MAAIAITNPFTVISDDDGTPLENGYVNIGTVNLDPISNPITVYWDQALTMPAAQPIRTINGYFSRNGSPGKLYVDAADYSILIRNKNETFLYSSLVNSNIATSIASTSVTGQFDASRIDFTQDGTGAVATTVDAKLNANISVKDFGAVGNGTADDTAEIQAALDSISSGVVHLPAGTYKITATIHMNTTKVTLCGDGNQTSILKAAIGFAGTEVMHMVNPSNCVVKDLQLDADSLVGNGLLIDDGSIINIQRVLIKNCTGIAYKLEGANYCNLTECYSHTSIDGMSINDGNHISVDKSLVEVCTGIGYKIRNVDNCILKECGTNNTTGHAYDFLASAALDAAATIDGLHCKLLDCYSILAGTTGAIYSEQVDTSVIDLLVERFKEVSNAGTISVDTNAINVTHSVKLIDCLFLDTVTSTGAVTTVNQFDAVVTGAIDITHATPTPIIQIDSIYDSQTDYAGFILVIVANDELIASSTLVTSYLLAITSFDDQVQTLQSNQTAEVDLTFTVNLTTRQLEAIMTSDIDRTRYFYITALGPIKVTNI